MLPRLAEQPITASYAGLRPATEFKDYQIEALPERRWITVAGIRSTGLSAALGIGHYVCELYQQHFAPFPGLAEIQWPGVANLCEYRPRPYQQGGHGEIVCHCEWVTRGEIEAALHGPLAAGTAGGLKRRTRAMMGRCQGFYCSWRVAELAGEILQPALARETVA
jgi:glycerol-3-phosphate dehydrogenase